MIKPFAILALSLFLVRCGSEGTPTGTDDDVAPEILAWLDANAVSFAGADPILGDPELHFLRGLVGDARIVALGEATHGTREFFQMKDRIVRFLVREMGFNLFAIEATLPESYRINDYVRTGVGNAAQLLSGIYFWIWNTEEVLTMIEWMADYNQGAGTARPVSFFGFDMQHPGMAVYNVERFIEETDPASLPTVVSLYDCYRPFLNDQFSNRERSLSAADAETQSRCAADVGAAYDFFAGKQPEYEAATSGEAFARVLRNARVVVQKVQMDLSESIYVRDEFMAENAMWLLDQADADTKMIIWAHNGHVNVREEWMGARLRREFDDDYVVFGFTFFQGGFNAIGRSFMSGNVVANGATRYTGPPPTDAYEHFLGSTGDRQFVLDLRDHDLGTSATSWLAGPRPFRLIGASFFVDNPLFHFVSAYLPHEYNAMIYFRDTTPSRLLPFDPPPEFGPALGR